MAWRPVLILTAALVVAACSPTRLGQSVDLLTDIAGGDTAEARAAVSRTTLAYGPDAVAEAADFGAIASSCWCPNSPATSR